MAKKIKKAQSSLLNVILEEADEKKAEDIITIDLSTIDTRVSDYFVICSASSAIQVESIVHNIESKVKTFIGEKPYSIEGLQNAYWVILDYISIVVHVMQTQAREYYELEKLWADALITKYNEAQI